MRGYGMRFTVNTNISRFILITGLVVFFILVMVTPVSAELRTINPGATIFRGESNLDITKAVWNSSRGSTPAALGWWPTPAAMSSGTRPTKMVYVCPSEITSFSVSPANFFAGNWYLLYNPSWSCIVNQGGSNLYNPCSQYNQQPCGSNPSDGYRLYDPDPSVPDHLAFVVADPTLEDIRVWDLDTNTDVTGKSIPQGNRLTFRVHTNQYLAANPQYRPNANPATDGYITIHGKGPNGMTLISIPQTNSVSNPLNVPLYVDSDNWQWGGSNFANTYWTTGMADKSLSTCISGGYCGYSNGDPGPYTFWATSNLNGMNDYWSHTGIGSWGKSESNIGQFINVVSKTSTTARTPTPIPTSAFGSLYITSSPAGATIFFDNTLKGITPLTINTVPNGAHIVLLRLHGYQDSSNSINVLGDNQTINPTLTPSTTGTTGATTIPTTASVTTTTTTGAIITELTTTVTTATPRTTATVNYSATIAAMQSQIAEQNVKITEQGNILDQITNFLRNVFGWK
jgi:hypothetical protein